jgi:methylisocitrate lyase
VKHPLLVNMLTGGVTPILSVDELGQLGYKIVVCPIESLLVTGVAMNRLIDALMQKGRCDLPASDMLTFAEIKKLLGLDDVMRLRGRLEADEPEA